MADIIIISDTEDEDEGGSKLSVLLKLDETAAKTQLGNSSEQVEVLSVRSKDDYKAAQHVSKDKIQCMAERLAFMLTKNKTSRENHKLFTDEQHSNSKTEEINTENTQDSNNKHAISNVNFKSFFLNKEKMKPDQRKDWRKNPPPHLSQDENINKKTEEVLLNIETLHTEDRQVMKNIYSKNDDLNVLYKNYENNEQTKPKRICCRKSKDLVIKIQIDKEISAVKNNKAENDKHSTSNVNLKAFSLSKEKKKPGRNKGWGKNPPLHLSKEENLINKQLDKDISAVKNNKAENHKHSTSNVNLKAFSLSKEKKKPGRNKGWGKNPPLHMSKEENLINKQLDKDISAVKNNKAENHKHSTSNVNLKAFSLSKEKKKPGRNKGWGKNPPLHMSKEENLINKQLDKDISAVKYNESEKDIDITTKTGQEFSNEEPSNPNESDSILPVKRQLRKRILPERRQVGKRFKLRDTFKDIFKRENENYLLINENSVIKHEDVNKNKIRGNQALKKYPAGPKHDLNINSHDHVTPVLEEKGNSSGSKLKYDFNRISRDVSGAVLSPSKKGENVINKRIPDAAVNGDPVSPLDMGINIGASSIDLAATAESPKDIESETSNSWSIQQSNNPNLDPSLITVEQVTNMSSNDIAQIKLGFVKSYHGFFDEDTENKTKNMGDLLLLAMNEAHNYKVRVSSSDKLTSDILRDKEVRIAKQYYQNLIRQYRRSFEAVFVNLHSKITSPQVIHSQRKNIMVALFLKIFFRVASVAPELFNCLQDAKLNFIELISKTVFNYPLVFLVFSCNDTVFEKNCCLVLDFMNDCSNGDLIPQSQEKNNCGDMNRDCGTVNIDNLNLVASCEKGDISDKNSGNTSVENMEEGILKNCSEVEVNSKWKKSIGKKYEIENKNEEYNQTIEDYSEKSQNEYNCVLPISNLDVQSIEVISGDDIPQEFCTNPNQQEPLSFLEQLNNDPILNRMSFPEVTVTSVKQAEPLPLLEQLNNPTSMSNTKSVPEVTVTSAKQSNVLFHLQNKGGRDLNAPCFNKNNIIVPQISFDVQNNQSNLKEPFIFKAKNLSKENTKILRIKITNS